MKFYFYYIDNGTFFFQLSGKTKQLITDLGTLRTLLVSLTQYDCVTFNAVVKSLKTTEQALKSAGWMLLDAAENLFITAKARVIGATPDAAGSFVLFICSEIQ